MIFYVKKHGEEVNAARVIFADSAAEAVRAFVAGLDLYPGIGSVLSVDCFEGLRHTGFHYEWRGRKKIKVKDVCEVNLKWFAVPCALPELVAQL